MVLLYFIFPQNHSHYYDCGTVHLMLYLSCVYLFIIDEKCCFRKIVLPYEEEKIGRVNHIGKSCKNESSGLIVKQSIVKFKSWKQRQNVYRNRTKRFPNGKKKLDFTMSRCDFLTTQGIVKEMDNTKLTDADVMRFLCIRFTNVTI